MPSDMLPRRVLSPAFVLLAFVAACGSEQSTRCGPDPEVWQVNKVLPELATFNEVRIKENGAVLFNRIQVSLGELESYLRQAAAVRRNSKASTSPVIVLISPTRPDCRTLNQVVQLIEAESECDTTGCALNPSDYGKYGANDAPAL